MVSVKEFVRTKCTYIGDMTYEPDRYGWSITGLPTKAKGVYFIVNTSGKKFDILKVGKAENKRGLRGRIQQYTSTSINRKSWDRTIQYLHSAMQSLLKEDNSHCKISLYVYEMATDYSIQFEGYELSASIIRSFEEVLAKQAWKEGNSLLLSGQDKT